MRRLRFRAVGHGKLETGFAGNWADFAQWMFRCSHGFLGDLSWVRAFGLGFGVALLDFQGAGRSAYGVSKEDRR